MHRSLSFAALLILPFSCPIASGEDWYRFRGPRLDGISPERDWQKRWPDAGPPIAWRASVGTGFSSMVVSDGRVYTMGNLDNSDAVYCLDAENGKQVWSHAYPAPLDPNEFEGGPTATPTVDGARLYTLSRRGELHCFDKLSGEVQWMAQVADAADVRIPAWGFSGSPLVWDQLLILNVGDAGIALNKLSGELVWRSDDKDAGYATPVPIAHSDPWQVIIGSARSYVCVEARTGKEVWRQRWLTTFGCNAADPIVREDRVFLSSGYNRGCALLDIGEGAPEILWKNKELQNQISTSLLIGQFIYGIHGDVDEGPSLRCLEWSTGNLMWSDDTIRPGGLSAANDHLIILSDSGELLVGAASQEGFDASIREQVMDEKCWTTPVLSNGRLYCRGAAGTLVCVDLRQSDSRN